MSATPLRQNAVPVRPYRAPIGRPPKPPRDLKEIPLAVAVERFILNGSGGRPMAEGTRNAKRTVTGVMVDKLGRDLPVWQAESHDFEVVLKSLVDGHTEAERLACTDRRRVRQGRTTEGSIELVVAAISQFIAYCQRHKWMSHDVFPPVPVIKVRHEEYGTEEKVEKQIFHPSQWPMILAAAERVSPRTRVAVALCLLLGRRISEVVHLQWSGIHWDARYIQFRNIKGGRQMPPMPLEPVREELLRWRNWVLAHYGEPDPDWYVVPAKVMTKDLRGAGALLAIQREAAHWPLLMDKKAITGSVRDDVTRMFREHFGIDIGEGATPHAFRHTSAVDTSLKHGLAVTQALLDHSNPGITQRHYEKYAAARSALFQALDPEAGETPVVKYNWLPVPAWFEHHDATVTSLRRGRAA